VTTGAIDYADPALQDASLRSLVALELAACGSSETVQEPEMPANLGAAAVEELVALVKADPEYLECMWAESRYASLLPLVLAAAGNNAGRFGDGVLVECTSQVGDTVRVVYVTALRTSDRVYFGCTTCGRQSFAMRTEIRNRLRYPNTVCESCNAVDRVHPGLAAMIVADPTTGVKRHPSRITAGTNDQCHFRCRSEGCPNVVQRKIKTLVRDGELPTCEAHRRRGLNFA